MCGAPARRTASSRIAVTNIICADSASPCSIIGWRRTNARTNAFECLTSV